MRHLYVVPDVPAGEQPHAAPEAPRARSGGATPPRQIRSAGAVEVPAAYVPVRLLLALAGRCSCNACCASYLDGGIGVHDIGAPVHADASQRRLHAVL